MKGCDFVKFRSAFNMGDRMPGLVCDAPSLTQQHFKNDADINTIIARYNRTGFLVDPLTQSTRQPLFGDFVDVPDFREAQTQIALAKERFMELPSDLRKRFHNDATELLDFLQDSKNLAEAVKLGLVNAPVVDDKSSVMTDGVKDGDVA